MIIHPIRCCKLSVCKLAGFHFTNDDGSSVNKPLNRDRIDGLRRIETIHSPIAIARLHASDVIDILDSKPDTCQRL